MEENRLIVVSGKKKCWKVSVGMLSTTCSDASGRGIIQHCYSHPRDPIQKQQTESLLALDKQLFHRQTYDDAVVVVVVDFLRCPRRLKQLSPETAMIKVTDTFRQDGTYLF